MESIWSKVKSELKSNVPDHSYRMWLEPLEFNWAEEDDRVTLNCPNYFFRNRVQENYSTILEAVINQISGRQCQLSFQVAGLPLSDTAPAKPNGADMLSLLPSPSRKQQQDLPNLSQSLCAGRMLRKDFTFDNFVVGGNNDFAYSAAQALATDGSTSQHTLFLLSKTGLGKSHLSQAIGHKILASSPRTRVCYVTAEDFAMEMIQAYQQKTIAKFKQKYRSQCDVLLLEDIHFLTGKERTQIELTQVLDYMFEADKKIIFSSCYLPADIPKLADPLRSRLSAGLISNIDRPDFATRVRILKTKTRQQNRQIPTKVIEYLAAELSEDVRQLEAGLAGVTARAALTGAPIDLDLATSVVETIARKKKVITIDRIKKMVCENFNITAKEIVSKSRKQQIVRPRQIAIFLARRYTDQPLQAIGKSFNRQHATAIHAVSSVENALKLNGTMKKQVDYLRKKLEERAF